MLKSAVIRWLGLDGLSVGEGVQAPTPRTRAVSAPATVNFDTAMQLSAVWACARLLSETIASLPMRFYIEKGGKKETADDHQLARLFEGKVNAHQTKVEFWETMILNLVMFGNAYALKGVNDGKITSLRPLMSGQVETRRLKDGSLVHYYLEDGNVRAYSQDRVWHLKLFGNGLVGLSPLGYARTSMGIGLAAEKRVSETFRNGGKPTGVLMCDDLLNDEQRKQVKAEFKNLKSGNSDELMVLEAGFKYETISMSPEDIQLLESRRFQIEDIARWFGVPSVLINDTESSTVWGSGIEQIVAGFYKLNLRPYLERIEASIVSNLDPSWYMTGTKFSVSFDLDALLRASQGERMEGWRKAVNTGLVTINEARQKEGYPEIPGGDVLLVNGNMIPVDMAGTRNTLKKDDFGG